MKIGRALSLLSARHPGLVSRGVAAGERGPSLHSRRARHKWKMRRSLTVMGSAPGGRTSGQRSRGFRRAAMPAPHRVAMPTGRRRAGISGHGQAHQAAEGHDERRHGPFREPLPRPRARSLRGRLGVLEVGDGQRPDKRYAAIAPPAPFVYDEQEPAGTSGPTTPRRPPRRSRASAPRRQVAGRAHPRRPLRAGVAPRLETAEDQGSIPLATETGIPATRTA